MKIERINTDVLIIGGGTAGCYSAITIGENSNLKVVVAEKANIRRSGCLAAGVNALNAYIVKGKRPKDYVDYAKTDADNIVREDLLITIAERFNRVTKKLEDMGLIILKDDEGNYVTRGNRNIKINGENIKPILADEVNKHPNVNVINYINIIDYIVEDNKILGAFGIDVEKEVFYVISSKAVICTTGGAAGLYKPNNPGFSQHKMWYSPFNTGAGYAMGIRSGAEMTTFEMRFIALRCKDTISPTGTIAQGVGARQINSLGEVYETKYGITTSQRVHGTVTETIEGRGPCYLKTVGISEEQDLDLMKAYLNMSPSQTLKWIESEKRPSEENVEIEGTEPYIVGGHTASGYWVDKDRQTTITGLFAAGDVAGGAPQKYVTGALAEGEIAAIATIKYVNKDEDKVDIEEDLINEKLREVKNHLENKNSQFNVSQLEEAMQKVMDDYAGGIKTNYKFNEKSLNIAKEKIDKIQNLAEHLIAENMQELVYVYELKERLLVCKVLIEHLKARKETRWHSFAENLDYPDKNNNYLKYINSVMKDGKIQIIQRDLVKMEDKYEHIN